MLLGPQAVGKSFCYLLHWKVTVRSEYSGIRVPFPSMTTLADCQPSRPYVTCTPILIQGGAEVLHRSIQTAFQPAQSERHWVQGMETAIAYLKFSRRHLIQPCN